jgi:hypothetical protein
MTWLDHFWRLMSRCCMFFSFLRLHGMGRHHGGYGLFLFAGMAMLSIHSIFRYLLPINLKDVVHDYY